MAAAAGGYHSAVVGEDGSLFVWGNGACGQLGTGDTAMRLAPTVAGLPAPVRQVAAGDMHTGIVTDAGDLLMCGKGEYGRLGLGDEDRRTTPTLVVRAVFAGEAVLMVACGPEHTAVVTEGGGVYTFGDGQYGQLGHGNREDQLAPRRVPAARFNRERVVMVAAGLAHTVALSEAGNVFTWGDSLSGQLGHGDKAGQLRPRQVGDDFYWWRREAATQWRCDKVVFVAAGGQHTVAVTAGGRLYTWWGRGSSGGRPW